MSRVSLVAACSEDRGSREAINSSIALGRKSSFVLCASLSLLVGQLGGKSANFSMPTSNTKEVGGGSFLLS